MSHTATVSLDVVAASFETSVWPPAANLVMNGTVTTTLSLVLDGSLSSTLATTPITFSTPQLPPGVVATFSPPSLDLAVATTTTVTFTAGTTQVPSTTTRIIATASDGSSRYATFDFGLASQLVSDGGFESSSSTAWSPAGNMVIYPWGTTGIHFAYPHLGVAWASTIGDGSIAQTFAIPTLARTTTLSYWMHGQTTAASPVTVDVIELPSYARTTIATYGDLAEPATGVPPYSRYDLDLSKYRGERIAIVFGLATAPGSTAGHFYLDDVAVAVAY